MKVTATKLANGKLSMMIQDNSNGRVVMKFTDTAQMEELSTLIMEESERMKRLESHFSYEEQRLKFT